MKSIKFQEKIIIQENQAELFRYTQDYSNRMQWDTFLQRADLLDGAKEAGLGVKAYCQAKSGIGLVTEYVSYRPPSVTAVKMTSSSPIFKSFQGSWTFHPLAEKESEVIFLYSFKLKFPFNLFSKKITNSLKRNVKQRLVDLKACVEV